MNNTIHQVELQNINQIVYPTDRNYDFNHSNHGVCVSVYSQENNQ